MSDNYIKEQLKAVNIAQTQYKETPFHKPWPAWEKQAEIAKQEFIKFLRSNHG